jgi:hypothetical protein
VPHLLFCPWKDRGAPQSLEYRLNEQDASIWTVQTLRTGWRLFTEEATVLVFAEPRTRRALCNGGRFVGPRRLILCETGDPNVLVLFCDQFPLVFFICLMNSSTKCNLFDVCRADPSRTLKAGMSQDQSQQDRCTLAILSEALKKLGLVP